MEKMGSPEVPAEIAPAWFAAGYERIHEAELRADSLLGVRTAFIKKLIPTDEAGLIDAMTTADVSDLLTVTDRLVHARGSLSQLTPATRLRVGLFLAGESVKAIAASTGSAMTGTQLASEREQLVKQIWDEDPQLPEPTRRALLKERYLVVHDFIKQTRHRQRGEFLKPQIQYSIPQLLRAWECSGKIADEERLLLEQHFLNRHQGLSDTQLRRVEPILEEFQQRAAFRLRLYDRNQDSRRPPRGRAAALLGHTLGSSINRTSPISRARLIRLQHTDLKIDHELDDRLLAYGVQWLLTKPQ